MFYDRTELLLDLAVTMKTENSTVNNDVVWSNVELPHLSPEECLPEIGSCHVTSILSNLDPQATGNEIPQNMELIVLQNNEYKIPEHSEPRKSAKKGSTGQESSSIKTPVIHNVPLQRTEKPKKKIKVQDNFEDILYFVCNSCPFLCTKDTKITEHVENAHKNKTVPKLVDLKCPACPNIFYSKISLKSHLIHDHGVANSELSSIIQAIIYFAKKNQNNKTNESHKLETKVVSVPQQGVNCKNEMELKYSGAIEDSEKILGNEDSLSNDAVNGMEENSEMEPEKSTEQQRLPLDGVVHVPMLNKIRTNVEKMFANVMKQNSLTKYLDQKKMHTCVEQQCKVKLQDLNKMNYHIGTHVNDGFKCLECNQVFGFWKPLTGHLWRVHKIDMELYSCDMCDYKTFSLGKLNNIHKLIHSDVKAFSCNVCQKAFKNSKQLRNHKITHKERSTKTVHLCEVCNKTFFNKRQLRVHMDGVHKKIKPYLCNYCGYKGASKSALKMHIRQHTGEKPFVCDTCNYTTADHNSLRRHRLRHSGIKPYKCIHCDYACIQSSTYKVHLKTKHPGLEKDLMFVCHECQFRSINREIYLTHLASVHKQKVYS